MQLHFLNPAALWALPLAASPWLIHWLSKPKVRFLEFSSLEFLRPLLERRRRLSKVQEFLLLLCRCLLAAGLVLLLAKPRLEGGKAVGKSASAVAVLLDASYSMAAQESGLSRFEKARQTARSL